MLPKPGLTKLNEKVKRKQYLGDGRLSVIFGNESVDLGRSMNGG